MKTYADPHYADERLVIKKLSVGETIHNVYGIVDPNTDTSVLVNAACTHDRTLHATLLRHDGRWMAGARQFARRTSSASKRSQSDQTRNRFTASHASSDLYEIRRPSGCNLKECPAF